MKNRHYCDDFWRMYTRRLWMQDELQNVSPATRDQLLAEYKLVNHNLEQHRIDCDTCKKNMWVVEHA